jgi:heme-degrading monooxygenase HmoA
VIAVIFEVEPRQDRRKAYFEAAAAVKPLLDRVEGFISVERFESLSTPGKLLSLSFFEDEAAVARWRTLGAHRRTQTAGRESHFLDYRLRVAEVRRDYGMIDRAEAPADSRAAHG